LKQLSHQRLFAIARMAAAAADNSLSAPRRAWFAEAAVAALKKNAEAGLRKADDLRSDPDFQPLVNLPAFRELLPLFDRAYESASQKLALNDAIDVADHITLSQAAARNAKVRMSGRITAVRSDQEEIRLWLAGKAGGLWVSGRYEKVVPALMATRTDLTDLVGGLLVFKEQPNAWDGGVSATLTQSNVIESFVPREGIAVSNLTAIAVTNVTASDLGRRLSVLGTIKSIGRWYGSSRSVDMAFAGTRKNGFIAVLPASQKAAFDKRFPLGSSTLTGSTIRLSGVIEVLDGTPQLLISDVQGLEVVTPAPTPELRAANEEFRPPAIPPRDPRAAANLIDLSPYYNAHLDQSWHSGSRGKSDLSALPSGIQRLAGVEFDVRGLIQVGGLSRSAQPYSNVVAGLRLERGCRRLHFLHAAINASGVANGTEIGRYVIHHSNGQSNEIQVTIGSHLAHWRRQSNEVEPKFVVAWMQSEESAAKERKNPARLFKMTWDNPLPGMDIKSIDLISTHQNAAPFLVAITAEP
jgi:hypothetical protein